MAADRLEFILGRLAMLESGEVGPAALCEVGREVLAARGTGLLLLSNPQLRVSIDGADAVMGCLHRLQLDLGEGPSWDAHRDGVPALEPDLAGACRWPAFAPAALAEGVAAIFCVPMQVGAVRLGAFTAWRDRRGVLTDDEHRDLLVLAQVGARLLLDLDVGTPTSWRGVLVDDPGIDFDAIVHQAVGMLSVQLGVSLQVALLRLRAHAFSQAVPVTELAAAVVSRRVRLEPDENSDGPL